MTTQISEKIKSALWEIVVNNGRSVVLDRNRLHHMLKDDCPGADREIDAIVAAVDEGIPSGMLDARELTETQVAEMARRLENGRGLSPESAEWTVKTWAFALERSVIAGPPPAAIAAPAGRKGARRWKTVGIVLYFVIGGFLAASMTAAGLDSRDDLTAYWTGSAEAQVCGQPAGSRQLKLELIGGWAGLGELTVDSNDDGRLSLERGHDGLITSADSPRPAGVSAESNTRSAYSVDLRPGGRWAGVANYQTLTGTLKRPSAACSDRGGEGEVLTVTLRRQ